MIRRFPVRAGQEWEPDEVVRRKVPRVNGLPLLHVRAVREQLLRTVSHQDALNEGFQGKRAREAFMLDWVRRHDGWAKRHPWASDAQLLERWRKVFAARSVLVVSFELVRVEREEFLAHQRPLSGHSTGGNGQYTWVGSIDRLPVFARSEEDVARARRDGAEVRRQALERSREAAAKAKADRGRLQRRRSTG